VADVFIVIEETHDGWYYGEKISDRSCGWFPSTHVKEITSRKVKESNLERRYRFMGDHLQPMKVV